MEMSTRLLICLMLVPMCLTSVVEGEPCSCPNKTDTWTNIGRAVKYEYVPNWNLPSNYVGVEIEVSHACKFKDGPPAVTSGVMKIAAYTRKDCGVNVFDDLALGQTYYFSGYQKIFNRRSAFVVSHCQARPFPLEHFSSCSCAYVPNDGVRGSEPARR